MQETVIRLKKTVEVALQELPACVEAFDVFANLDEHGRFCHCVNPPLQIRCIVYRRDMKNGNAES